MSKYRFDPDYVVAPGATLKESIDTQGISQIQLAQRTGLAEKTISQIVNGIAPISHETAAKLELVTGVPAGFWNRRELSYREALARQAERERLASEVAWLEEIPVQVLVKRKYIDETRDKRELVWRCLRFFGVSSVDSWRDALLAPAVRFRGQTVQEKRPGYVAAWLRMGHLRAEERECESFDAQKFRKALGAARAMTVRSAREWKPELERLCAAAGVALVFTPEIPSASVSGATRWLKKDVAILQLSLKYKTTDQLWFSFFHEGAHILFHSKRCMFLEFPGRKDSDEEREADRFARDILIPLSESHRLPYLRTHAAIQQFARSIGVHPGIVVGRLQHDGLLSREYCNRLKKPIDWGSKVGRK
jgi:HTH-type transcriptional regulator/antitoxin HigA